MNSQDKSHTRVEEYNEELFFALLDICNGIYIARNITLDNDAVIDNLKKIDRLLRDDNWN